MNLRQSNIYLPKIIFKKVFYCQIGKLGVATSYKKSEGDLKTPIGKWELGKIFIRKDKIRYLKVVKILEVKFFILKKLFWCDKGSDSNYNKLFINKKITI